MQVNTLEKEIISTKNDNLESKRTRCEIYTRVMWYYRAVSHFNTGKKSEFYSRQYFEEQKSQNSKFIDEYKN